MVSLATKYFQSLKTFWLDTGLFLTLILWPSRKYLCPSSNTRHPLGKKFRISPLDYVYVFYLLQNWIFLARFCFLSDIGRLRFEVEYPQVSIFSFQISLNTLFNIVQCVPEKRKPINRTNFSENCNDLSEKVYIVTKFSLSSFFWHQL